MGAAGRPVTPEPFVAGASTLEIESSGPVVPLLRMPDGRVAAGFLADGVEVNQVFGSLSASRGGQRWLVEVPGGAEGAYTLILTGAGSGPFTARVSARYAGFRIYRQELTGEIRPGEQLVTRINQRVKGDDPSTARVVAGTVEGLRAWDGDEPAAVVAAPGARRFPGANLIAPRSGPSESWTGGPIGRSMSPGGTRPWRPIGSCIVGASLAGASAAATLREEGFEGEMTLIGAEARLPYSRPPLSKGYLRGQERFEDQLVNPPAFYAEHRIDLRLGASATPLSIRRGRWCTWSVATRSRTTACWWRPAGATAALTAPERTSPASSSSAPWRTATASGPWPSLGVARS